MKTNPSAPSLPRRARSPRLPRPVPTLHLRLSTPVPDGKGKRGIIGGNGDGVDSNTRTNEPADDKNAWVGLGPLADRQSEDPTSRKSDLPRRFDLYLDHRLVYRAISETAVAELWNYYAPHLGHALTYLDVVAATPFPPASLR